MTFCGTFSDRQDTEASVSWEKSREVNSDVISVMHTLCNLRLNAEHYPLLLMIPIKD